MPWLIAIFLVVQLLVPFNGIEFKVNLPANLTLDRLIIALMLALMAVERLLGITHRVKRKRTGVERAVLIYTGIAMLSIVVSIDRIARLNYLSFAEKGFSQYLGYIAFFFIVIATVRPDEFKALAKFLVFLTCITAAGVLYEAHSGVNIFYNDIAKIFRPVAEIAPSPTTLFGENGRPTIVGPTQHGLAVTSMLAIALPFAATSLLNARTVARRIGFVIVVGIIIAAAMSTARKTAVLAPIAAFAVLFIYDRRLRRWAPLLIVALIPVIHVVAPGTIGTLTGILGGAKNSPSTQARVGDYSAVAPDILSNLILGRGFGTLDPDNYRWYRILDNEYLDQIFTVGFVGLVAYVGIVVAALGTAHRVIRDGGNRGTLALAAAAGCAAFGLVSATFDAMSFPEAPYMFFFSAAMIASLAAERSEKLTRLRASIDSHAKPPSPGGLRRGGHEIAPRTLTFGISESSRSAERQASDVAPRARHSDPSPDA
jgi:O-antigen ligase